MMPMWRSLKLMLTVLLGVLVALRSPITASAGSTMSTSPRFIRFKYTM